MQLAKEIQEQIKDGLWAKPLERDEIRRIEGMGKMYLANTGITLPDEYTEMMLIEIDGSEYHILRME